MTDAVGAQTERLLLAWMTHAWSEIGQREIPGAMDNPRILAFYRELGFDSAIHDEVAWCAAFVGTCLQRAGLTGTKSLLARSYMNWGQTLDVGRFGAIAVFSRGSDAASGHVAFYLDSDADRVFVLGGNQSDAVGVTMIERSRLLGLRWPANELVTIDRQPTTAAVPPASTFNIALAHVLEMEGGWTEDPVDPGGPTNFGITLATLAASRRVTVDAVSFPMLRQALRQISVSEMRAIYQQRYWLACRADALTPALAVMHFDATVNHGLGASSRMLQEAAGIAVDGDVGPITIAACATLPPRPLLNRYADIRRARYRALPHFWRFGRGWLARVDATLGLSITLVNKPSNGDAPMSDLSNTTAIALPAAPSTPVKWWGQSLTVWGAIITAVSTVLPTLGPLVGLDISAEMIRQLGGQAAQAMQALGGIAGTLMTLYGRVRATARLERRAVTVQL